MSEKILFHAKKHGKVGYGAEIEKHKKWGEKYYETDYIVIPCEILITETKVIFKPKKKKLEAIILPINAIDSIKKWDRTDTINPLYRAIITMKKGGKYKGFNIDFKKFFGQEWDIDLRDEFCYKLNQLLTGEPVKKIEVDLGEIGRDYMKMKEMGMTHEEAIEMQRLKEINKKESVKKIKEREVWEEIMEEKENGVEVTANKKDYIFCPECGAKIPRTSKFCMECSYKFE